MQNRAQQSNIPLHLYNRIRVVSSKFHLYIFEHRCINSHLYTYVCMHVPHLYIYLNNFSYSKGSLTVAQRRVCICVRIYLLRQDEAAKGAALKFARRFLVQLWQECIASLYYTHIRVLYTKLQKRKIFILRSRLSSVQRRIANISLSRAINILHIYTHGSEIITRIKQDSLSLSVSNKAFLIQSKENKEQHSAIRCGRYLGICRVNFQVNRVSAAAASASAYK